MVKKDLVEEVVYKTGLNKTIVRAVVDNTFEVMTKSLREGNRIELRGFGVFDVKKRKPKKARNPKTGTEVMVPERNKVVFKPSKLFKG